MELINCLNPVVILNPSYLSYLVSCDKIFILKNHCIIRKFDITPSKRGKVLDGCNFYNVFGIGQVYRDLDFFGSFFLDSRTGESFPLFMLVPCGHCDACNQKRHSSIIQRLNFGFEEDEGLSLYVTLTYNDLHLPKDGVCRRDVQLFKKRLNKLVFEKFNCRLKYGYFSEYGDDGRPHYHMIIYGMPFISDKSAYKRFEFFSRLLQFCWRSFPKKGYSKLERFDFDNYLNRNYTWFNITSECKNSDPYSLGFVNVEFPQDGKCFGYISKYISKSSNVPEGKNKNFYNLSNNLGVSFVKKRVDALLSNNSVFRYRSKYGSSVKELYLSSYYIRKLFPSLSTLVPVEFRRSWMSFHYDALWLSENPHLPSFVRHSALTLLDCVNKKFPSLCPILDFDVSKDGMLVYSYLYNKDVYVPEVSDDFLKSFEDKYNYLMSFPDDFEDYVNKMICLRDMFLRPYNKLSCDPCLSALKFSKTYNRYFSSKKF